MYDYSSFKKLYIQYMGSFQLKTEKDIQTLKVLCFNLCTDQPTGLQLRRHVDNVQLSPADP